MAEQPAKHGRDHLPSGYAVQVTPVTEDSTLIEGGADDLRAVEGAAASYPYCWRKMDVGQSIGAGTTATIDWSEDDFTQAAGYFTRGDSLSLSVNSPGVYDWVCGIVWEPEFNSVCALQVQCDAFGYSPTVFGKGGVYTAGGSLILGNGVVTLHFQARMAEGPVDAIFNVAHENGSSQTILEAFARVARVASWSGSVEHDFNFGAF